MPDSSTSPKSSIFPPPIEVHIGDDMLLGSLEYPSNLPVVVLYLITPFRIPYIYELDQILISLINI